jgi:hypothetical protein
LTLAAIATAFAVTGFPTEVLTVQARTGKDGTTDEA